jgi:hypothetical protein
MATWIEPLEMEKWILQVFSGNPDVFVGVAILTITSFAAYFRMNGLMMFLMLGTFLLMFSNYISEGMFVVFMLVGGIVIGFTLRKIFQ